MLRAGWPNRAVDASDDGSAVKDFFCVDPEPVGSWGEGKRHVKRDQKAKRNSRTVLWRKAYEAM